MRHGGELASASRFYGIAEADWLDLSTGINPRPWPGATAMAVSDLRFDRLPTADGLERLLGAARSAFGIPPETAIAAVPGTEPVIRSLPHLVTGRAGLVATSYASYPEAWRQADAPLELAETAAAAGQDPKRSVVLVNPNNPDGRIVPSAELLSLARSRSGGALIVVDEAFADAEDGVSVAPHLAAGDPVLVLRSLGKFYGLPGLRLGFAIGSGSVVHRLALHFGDWPVSSAALVIGSRALADSDWQNQTRDWLAVQAVRLDEVLRSAGLKIRGGTRLFRLAEAADAARLHKKLAECGIWTRIWPEAPHVIRFGLPRDEAGLSRLGEALTRAVGA